MKKQLLFFMMMLLPMIAMADKSGKCGSNLTWTLVESTGTLTIEGNGAMKDFSPSPSVHNFAPWYDDKTILKVVIGEGVTSIGDYAFYKCSTITSITIPNSMTNIGRESFNQCYAIKSVHISDLEAWCNITFHASDSNPLFYSAHLYLGDEEIKDLVIPQSIKSIKSYAFFGCQGLTSVTIPNSVTSIGNDAFANIFGLTSVHITDLETWCNITFNSGFSNPLAYAHHLYLGDEEIKDLEIPQSIKSIKSCAFYGCSGLTSVNIHNNVTSIGGSAFYECTGLTSVTIPNSVTDIGSCAFFGCFGLTSVTIGNCVTSIGSYAFYGCSGLTSTTIGNSVTSIEEAAFEYCTGLTSVTIPNSVTSIGTVAFYGCSALTSLTIGNGVASIGSLAFESTHVPIVISLIENPFTIPDISSLERVFDDHTVCYGKLYVPAGAIDKYKSTKGWKGFSNIYSYVTINEENFPDENFRNYLRSQTYGYDGIITSEEIETITNIDIQWVNISSLKGIEFFTKLTTLKCYGTRFLTSLDVSNNTALTSLDCGINKLTNIDLSKNTALTSLNVSGNQLTSLDVSNNTALASFHCEGNQLSSLDVSKNTLLTDLSCHYNNLATLDVSNNPELTYLNCNNNQLTTLDVSNNTQLTDLICFNNQLLTLDLTNNTALIDLYCSNNLIKNEYMDVLVSSLPVQNNATLCVIDLSNETEGNICTKTQVRTAKKKGWFVMAYDGNNYIEYKGSAPTGIQYNTLDKETNSPIYNINGRKLETPQKGINIIGVKKVIVK